MHVGLRRTADALPPDLLNHNMQMAMLSKSSKSRSGRPRGKSPQEMHGNSQLLRSVNLDGAQNLDMKTTVMLLLTNDSELEDAVAEALLELGGVSHLTHDPGDALETICAVNDLDLAIIDFEHGPHGMTLLSAISMLRGDLPVIVIAHDDEKHVEALAYTNGATACFSKPVSTTQLVATIREFCGARVEQALA